MSKSNISLSKCSKMTASVTNMSYDIFFEAHIQGKKVTKIIYHKNSGECPLEVEYVITKISNSL